MTISYFGRAESNSALPIGSVVTGLLTNDTNYVPANGTVYFKNQYPILAQRIGTIPSPDLQTQSVTAFGSTEAYDVASNGSNLFVACAGGGQIATSTNGTSWTLAGSTVANAFTLSYVANNTTFYLTTTDGKLYSSTNGTSWTLRATFSGKKLGKVIYAAGGYFVGDTRGDIYSSTNGTSFSLDMTNSSNSADKATDPIWDGSNLYIIQYSVSDSKFYRIKMDWSGTDLVWHSPTPFTEVSLTGLGSDSTLERPVALISFSSKYIMLAKTSGNTNYTIYYSTDLVTWTRSTGAVQISSGNSRARLVSGGSTVCWVAGSNICTSTNSTGWTNRTSAFFVSGDSSASKINGVAYISSGSTWAKVGGNGKVASGNASGSTWTLQTSPFTASSTVTSNAICTDGTSNFLLVGDSGVAASSPTGAAWNSVTSGVATSLFACGYGNGKWLIGGTSTVLRYSTDLVTFTACSGHSGTVYNIQYGNSVWVALTSTGIFKSSDGITFTAASSSGGVVGNSDAKRLTFGNGIFVVVSAGAIYTSLDGDVWTAASNPSATTLNRVFFNGTVFMSGATSSATCVISSDGMAWYPVGSFILTGAAEGLFLTTTGLTSDGVTFYPQSGLPATSTQTASYNGYTISTGSGSVLRGTLYGYDTSSQFLVPVLGSSSVYQQNYYKAR